MGEFLDKVHKAYNESFSKIEVTLKEEIEKEILIRAHLGYSHVELRWYREKSFGIIRDEMIENVLKYLKREGFSLANLSYSTNEKIHIDIRW